MIFLTKAQVIEMHEEVLAVFGGESGFLNEPSLDSAIAAARHRAYYESAGLAQCAATYAFHVTKAHAFVDGNKRLGAATATAFLAANGAALDASEDEFHSVVLAIAATRMTRDEVDA